MCPWRAPTGYRAPAPQTERGHLKSYLLAETPELAERYQDEFQFLDLAPPGDALQQLLIIAAVALVLGVWKLSRRQFLLPS